MTIATPTITGMFQTTITHKRNVNTTTLEAKKFRHERVMLIDDDELDNFLSEKTLSGSLFAKKIYVNRSASSAVEALKIMCIKPDYAKEILPEVLFIDKNMPGMDGIELITYFENLDSSIMQDRKIVILSAHFSPSDKKRIENLKTKVTLMNKPITKEKLDAL
jgi:two-component system chemotaxis response regulator CheY